MWRVEEPAEIEAIAVAFRSEADRQTAGTFYNLIADRILKDAKLTAPVEAQP